MRALFMLLLLSLAVLANAQTMPPVAHVASSEHTTYAFTNATVHVDARTAIPKATLLVRDGEVLGVGADVAARTLRPPEELRLGVLTALLGGPFFLYLVVAHKLRVETL